jgi:hypothetical protein
VKTSALQVQGLLQAAQACWEQGGAPPVWRPPGDVGSSLGYQEGLLLLLLLLVELLHRHEQSPL